MTTSLREAVAAQPLWYHVLDLPGGVTTPGWFDLRRSVDRLPWPQVRGARCLDVGTYDGFLAFTMEQRGAAEVVAVDIDDHRAWDWPVDARRRAPDDLAQIAGPEKGAGFRIAAEALGSSVRRLPLSVYDLSPDTAGRFDVVVMGSLLLHLRDPLRALEAVRSVCDGVLLSVESVDLALTALHPRRPVARLKGTGTLCQWWEPSVAGHRQMVRAGGFSVERATGPFPVEFGPAHPPQPRTFEALRTAALRRVLAGGQGVPHSAVLARPVA
ncbi:MAG TPA: class I SAM-dependent methyltransferase [Mycobacteriales bacterium]|nr:class I SAM-dependent methyltransferase [Mycobacteriales bacterium]